MRSPGATFDLRAAMAQELSAALEELDAGGGPKALHRCRVRLKRARTLARIGKVVAPGLASVFNDSARTVMRSLAQARDVSVLADTARLLAVTARTKEAEALVATADALDRDRAALPELDHQSVRVGIKDLTALAQVWPEASARQIRSGAKRIAKRARRAFRRARGAREAPLRHKWRKCEKDRFYAANLMQDAWPGPRRRKRGETLTHLLGLERDALLLIERLETEPMLAGDAATAKRAQRVLQKHRKRLQKRADKLGERVHLGGA